MDGDEGRVQKLLSDGTSPNTTDSAGYTPLVGGAAAGYLY